jgi:hypothetical protein
MEAAHVLPERPMIPARFAPVLFSLIVTGLMSCLVSAIATFRAIGMAPEFLGTWMTSWAVAWAVAFPTMLVVAPATRRLVARLTASGDG